MSTVSLVAFSPVKDNSKVTPSRKALQSSRSPMNAATPVWTAHAASAPYAVPIATPDDVVSSVERSPLPSHAQCTPPRTARLENRMMVLEDEDSSSNDIKRQLEQYEPGKFIPINREALFHRPASGSPLSEADQKDATTSSTVTTYSQSMVSSYATAAEDEGEGSDGVDDASISPEESISMVGMDDNSVTQAIDIPKKPATSYLCRLWRN